MIKEYEKLLHKITHIVHKKFPDLEYEDLYQQAYLYALTALKTYDPNKAKLTSYLYTSILRRLNKYAHKQKSLIFHITYEGQKRYYNPVDYVSLDAPINENSEDEPITFIDTQETTDNHNPLYIEDLINKLPEDLKEIIHLYYYENLSLEQIGKQKNLSKERIRQLKNKALKIMKEAYLGNTTKPDTTRNKNTPHRKK